MLHKCQLGNNYPTEHRIVIKSLDWLNKKSMEGIPWNHPERQRPRFVKGMVSVKDVENKKLIIYTQGNDVETITHETVHYCVNYMFKNGFMAQAQEDLTRRITAEFLYSEAFQKYVKDLKIGE